MRPLIALFFFSLLFPFLACQKQSDKKTNYQLYHQKILQIERLIANEEFAVALDGYNALFGQYDFVFLRDIKNAAQLAFLTSDKKLGMEYLEIGLDNGWELQELKLNSFLQSYLEEDDRQELANAYPALRANYQQRIDNAVRDRVKALFDKDQELAMKAAMIQNDSLQEQFILDSFPGQSIDHMRAILQITRQAGYPGEQLIGNNYWGSTIISHHNSIAPDFTRNDTLFPLLQPKLIDAIAKGRISPYEYALMNDWRAAMLTEYESSDYGYLIPPRQDDLARIDQNRKQIGLRSVGLRNKLVDVQNKTGMDLGLPDWIEGKIQILTEQKVL